MAYGNKQNTPDVEELKKEYQALLAETEQSEDERLARLLQHEIDNIQKIKEAKKRADDEVNSYLLKAGFSVEQIKTAKSKKERLKAIDDDMKRDLSQAGLTPEEKKKIKEKYKAQKKEELSMMTDVDKEKTKLQKKQNIELGKQLTQTVTSAWSSAGLTGIGGALFGGKIAKDALRQSMEREDGESDEEFEKRVNKAARGIKSYAIESALGDFAKQLGNDINTIAHAQTEIDTRLYGSRGAQYMGSYWKQMNLDVTRYVGMSPIVKQNDVITKLKDLVGKGISFNVEQRAFLDTISDKIATTFDATDATLLKLVRIQQQDTTAARLGMESALNAFLNNMYETTEYMTEMATNVRQNLYEASALMTAEGATEFEYQVQKWMGSLFSVGFGKSSELSSALGKLAAGDISGLTEGGIGNLLIMAANEAGISITEALENGLNADKTNQLMEAMVDYLGKIYNDSQGSKVIAQQFANVYGLSASDLKAASNLMGSKRAISSNGLGYGGMLQQLNMMANSMYARTSTGEMMTNMFDNLKFATASTLANNPVLYSIYSIAGMLDSTVGGIAIPAISTMFGGVDLETTVADLMRVASVGTGILGGLGKMLSGLGTGGGFSGSGMLRAFGVGSSPNVVTRGTGSGLLTSSLTTTSESGSYSANGDADDIQNKTMTDANDDANNQLRAKEDDDSSDNITIKDVNGNVIAIYDLLSEVTTGTRTLKVDMGDVGAWSEVIGERA